MNNNKLTCKDARQVSLFHFLKENGINPVKLNDKEAWYLSPFRNEKTASFKVSLEKNVWYDFGEGQGGSIIEYIIFTHHCDYSHALQIISNSQKFIHQPKINNVNVVDKGGFELKRIRELTSSSLLIYISNRGIDINIAKKYCHEVAYGFRNKIFIAIGFKSDRDGIELRSRHFKGSYLKKTHTTIINNSDTILVFEGFFDFLSYLTINGDDQTNDYLILNSVALVDKALIHIGEYQKIELFLDNDTAGTKATLKIQQKFQNAQDKRNTYKDFNDLNEYLIAISNPV